MSIAEKLQTIAENEQKVYHAGELSLAAFLGDTKTKIRLPDGITHLKQYVCGGTWTIRELIIPSTVYDLANGVFSNGFELQKVTFEGGKITRFGAQMFSYNPKLKTVIFGCEVPEIVSNTFTGCDVLEEVTFAQPTLYGKMYFHFPSTLKKSCAYEIMRKLNNYIGTSEELTYTFKLHANVWANVEDTTAEDYETPPSGETWKDYVTNYKGYLV